MPDHTSLSLTRRQLLRVLALSGIAVGGHALWRAVHSNAPGSDPERVLTIDLPEPVGSVASFPVFFALSQIITAREHLNKTAAEKLYAVFLKEPWGAEHIAQIYKRILSLLNKKSPLPLYETHYHQKLSVGHQWFVTHLLTTWYTGVYYHESSPSQRVIYEDALMFEVVNTYYPIPFKTKVGFGEWVSKPAPL